MVFDIDCLFLILIWIGSSVDVMRKACGCWLFVSHYCMYMRICEPFVFMECSSHSISLVEKCLLTSCFAHQAWCIYWNFLYCFYFYSNAFENLVTKFTSILYNTFNGNQTLLFLICFVCKCQCLLNYAFFDLLFFCMWFLCHLIGNIVDFAISQYSV